MLLLLLLMVIRNLALLRRIDVSGKSMLCIWRVRGLGLL
jgi:hypothetical protein